MKQKAFLVTFEGPSLKQIKIFFGRLEPYFKIYDWLTMVFEVKHIIIISRPKLNSAEH